MNETIQKAVMVSIGPKTMVDEAIQALRKEGAVLRQRTRRLGVPYMGIVMDMDLPGNESSLRKTAVPAIRKMFREKQSENECSVTLFLFRPEEAYSETSIIWSGSGTYINDRGEEAGPDDDKLNRTNGRVYVTTYPLNPDPEEMKSSIFRKMAFMTHYGDRESADLIGRGVRETVARQHEPGIVNVNSQMVLWTDGKGTIFSLCPKKSVPSLQEVAFGDRGVGAEALKNGFLVWVEENTNIWGAPGCERSPSPVIVRENIGSSDPDLFLRLKNPEYKPGHVSKAQLKANLYK